MFTLFRIAFGRHETISDRASVHPQKWLGAGGEMSVTKQSCTAPIDL